MIMVTTASSAAVTICATFCSRLSSRLFWLEKVRTSPFTTFSNVAHAATAAEGEAYNAKASVVLA